MQHLFHRRREAPDLWVRCGGCHDLIYRREFENNLRTCSKCNFHERLPAKDRIQMLLDEGTWSEEDAGLAPGDPLSFVTLDLQYTKYTADQRTKTGLND